MEIQNPGILPFGMTMEDFIDGVSKVRNRVIVCVFREPGADGRMGFEVDMEGYWRYAKTVDIPDPG